MKLVDITEMTMLAGDLSYTLSRYMKQYSANFPDKFNHDGDIEDVEIWKSLVHKDVFIFVIDNKPIGWFCIQKEDFGWEMTAIYVDDSYKGLKLFEKTIWYAKIHLKKFPLFLGKVHSEATVSIVKKLSSAGRMNISWFDIKSGKKTSFKDNPELGYDKETTTSIRVMLENDRSYEEWPRFFDMNKCDLTQFYEVLLN